MGFESEGEMEQYMNDLDSCVRTHILAGIVVTSTFDNGLLAPEVTYKLRPLSEKRIGGLNVSSIADWNTDASFMGFDVTGPRLADSARGGLPG
jgi:hypothetical protein